MGSAARRARVVLAAVVVVCLLLNASPARAQVVFLQNDSYTGGPLLCYTGIGDTEAMAAKFTAAPAQYPYTIDRVRVFGCGGGQDAYVVAIRQDDGGGVNPGPLIWQSSSAFFLSGANTFTDILVSAEIPPPPPITSGSVRVELALISILSPIGFGADLDGIMPQRNYLRDDTGAWSFAESQGVNGDWILRLGIVTGTPTSADLSVVKTDSADPVSPGAPLTYTIQVTNNGPDASTGMTLTDTLPPGVTFVSSSPGAPTCNHASGTVTCNLGPLASGNTTTVTIDVTVNLGASGTLSNTASVVGNDPDPVLANNSDVETTTVTGVPGGLDFFTVTPCRVVDTRGGAPNGGPPLDAQTTRVLAVAGNCGIPATAQAISLNVAVTQASAAGNLRLFPTGSPLPNASAINYSAGQTRGNNGIIPLNASGQMSAYAAQASGTVHLIIDVNGYFE